MLFGCSSSTATPAGGNANDAGALEAGHTGSGGGSGTGGKSSSGGSGNGAGGDIGSGGAIGDGGGTSDASAGGSGGGSSTGGTLNDAGADAPPADAAPPRATGTPVALSLGGSDTACALYSGGEAECWGNAAYGLLGSGFRSALTNFSTTPLLFEGLTDATAISVGTNFACALISDGTAKCWGYNGGGGLGNGTMDNSFTPVVVTGLAGATAVAAGASGSACALVSGGAVKCWGFNSFGALGTGSNTGPDSCFGTPCAMTPADVTGVSGATAVAVGFQFACALLSGGTIDCWGTNSQGQLGDGLQTYSASPVSVSGITNAVAITAGDQHACALLSTGAVECWGNNDQGQLGMDVTTGPESCSSDACSTTPRAVVNISSATAISAGRFTTCALLSDGSAQCWGNGGEGELGNGSVAMTKLDPCNQGAGCSPSPVAVSGLTGATAISVGGDVACALLPAGVVQCWGGNTSGELGIGTDTGPSACNGANSACSVVPVTVKLP